MTTLDKIKKGKVYLASFNIRGKWWHNTVDTFISNQVCQKKVKIINVTSVQGKDNQYRKDFSPMTSFEHHFSADQLPVEYQNYYCFENYWQGGKVYQNVDKKLSDQWWFKQNKGKRKLRVSRKMLIDKNKNWKNDKYDGRVLHSVYSDINNGQEILGKNYSDNWILSRKKVYVPKYYQLLIKTKSFIELKEYVNKGKDVIVYDIDGPRKISDNKDSELDCIEINQLNLKNKINCDKFPFGHGYIVAAALADINLEKFIN